jgi:adenine-specific DNA-methyltransferase
MTATRLTPALSFAEERLAKLREVVPEAFADGHVNWDSLREALGNWLESDDAQAEHFGLTWPGKRDARRAAAALSRGTLVPAPGEGVDEATTKNVFIEGDNLEVLKLLRKSYAGRVKLIYIDPPYNTGNDFVYRDDYREPIEDYLRKTRQADEEGRALTTNPRASGRFHSNWLSMMYPRLRVARELLRDDGFAVVSIDDVEAAHLRLLLNDAFGEENYLATLVFDRNRKNDARFFSVGHEYMYVYARDKSHLLENDVVLRVAKEGVDDVRTEWERLRALRHDDWPRVREDLRSFFGAMADDDPRKPLSRFTKVDEFGPYRDDADISWPGGGGPRYAVEHPRTGRACKIPRRGWVFANKERMNQAIAAGVVVFGPDETTTPRVRTNLFERTEQVLRSVQYSYAQTSAQQFDALFDGKRVFDNPKPVKDLSTLVRYLTIDEDVILDFFAGSATTAHAVLEANGDTDGKRTFVCVQLPETVAEKGVAAENARRIHLDTIAEIGKERLRRAMKQLRANSDRSSAKDLGFRVYKLDRSNFRAWRDYEGSDPAELELLFADAETPLVAGWTPARLLPEVMLIEGFPLDSTVIKPATKPVPRVFIVESPYVGHRLLACFDDTLDARDVDAMELVQEDVFVCLDSALTDRAKMRIADRCTLRTI